MASFLKRVLVLPVLVIGFSVLLSLSAASGEQALAQTISTTDAAPSSAPVTVFRSPTCGCCGLWSDHMREAGFEVEDNITSDMDTVKQQLGVTPAMASCHTAIIGHYILEGHVPAADVQKLLADQPDVAGLAAPGMPMGSPGMEQGGSAEPYTVFSFDHQGESAPFAHHS